jgi:predicted GNAT family acetyltransferase
VSGTGEIDLRPAEVIDRPQRSRFELVRRGDVLAFLDYRLTPRHAPEAIILTHAEVRPELRGQGYGEQLVAGALEQLAPRGLEVVPRCRFVAGYLRRHPEARPGRAQASSAS